MNGLLIIDKPAGITSHDVVSRVRRILKTRRVGHTGTLDPFATGVMVVLVGQATRLAQFLDKDEKEYEALVRFGFETDTGDLTGSPKSQVPGPRSQAQGSKSQGPGLKEFSEQDIESALSGFRGEIEQTPPMYSAKKIDGKKLYEHARKGEIIDRNPITVNIRKLELMDGVSEPELRPGIPDLRPDARVLGLKTSDLGSGTPELIPHTRDLGSGTWDLGRSEDLRLRVACSAGTYIRTLAEDIGRRLGTGAHLAGLRRTRAGKFSLDRGLTLDELETADDPASALIAMDDAVSHLSKFILPDDRVVKTKNGLSSRVRDTTFDNGEVVQMVDGTGELIAIGFYDAAENTVQPRVVLI